MVKLKKDKLHKKKSHWKLHKFAIFGCDGAHRSADSLYIKKKCSVGCQPRSVSGAIALRSIMSDSLDSVTADSGGGAGTGTGGGDAVAVAVAEVSDFCRYLSRAGGLLLAGDEDSARGALLSALQDRAASECVRKFISEPQVPCLYLQRATPKGLSNTVIVTICAYFFSLSIL